MKNSILETISGSVNYNRWLYNNIKPFLSGDILDVGSGIGNIVKYYSADTDVKKIILSDKSTVALEQLKRKFACLPNYNIEKLDICAEVETNNQILGRVDAITCINVLEHLDIKKALRNIHKALSDRGVLIIIVPAIPFIYGSLDKLTGHNCRYTKNTLNKNLSETGFIIKKQHYINLFGVITWFLAGRVLKLNKFNGSICKILDKIVPVLEIFEKHCPPIIGQSLLTVCCKNDTGRIKTGGADEI